MKTLQDKIQFLRKYGQREGAHTGIYADQYHEEANKLEQEILTEIKRVECQLEKLFELIESMPASLRDMIPDWGDCDERQ